MYDVKGYTGYNSNDMFHRSTPTNIDRFIYNKYLRKHDINVFLDYTYLRNWGTLYTKNTYKEYKALFNKKTYLLYFIVFSTFFNKKFKYKNEYQGCYAAYEKPFNNYKHLFIYNNKKKCISFIKNEKMISIKYFYPSEQLCGNEFMFYCDTSNNICRQLRYYNTTPGANISFVKYDYMISTLNYNSYSVVKQILAKGELN